MVSLMLCYLFSSPFYFVFCVLFQTLLLHCDRTVPIGCFGVEPVLVQLENQTVVKGIELLGWSSGVS